MINSPKKIFIRPSHGKGLGVFASESISQGETIEDCPLLSLPIKKGESSSLLLDYRFNYPLGLDFEEQVIALGYGSLYNHSDTPNAKYNTLEKFKADGATKLASVKSTDIPVLTTVVPST